MQSNNRSRNTRRRNRNRQPKHSLLREYAAPVLRKIDRPSVDITLFNSALLGSGVVGTNGLIATLNFNDFSDISEFLGVYKYCEFLGYKIDFSMSTTTAAEDSFYDGAVALNPLNYVVGEVPSSSVPNGIKQVMDLPGAIYIQPGANNRGKWVPPPSKQVFCP